MKERWLAFIGMGYLAWVIPYDIRQFAYAVSLTEPTTHTAITLTAIAVVCGVLTIVLIWAGEENPLILGLTLAILWLVICLIFDFGLDTYYRDWKPNVAMYCDTRAWHFVFAPVGCILAGSIAHFIWKPKQVKIAPIHNTPRLRR